jgi:hypothetical protein
MGTIVRTFCIPKPPGTIGRSTLLSELAAEGFIAGPYWAGGAFYETAGHVLLRSPEHPQAGNPPGVAQSCETPEQAEQLIQGAPDAAITATALARAYRREPQHFYDYPAGLGLYRFRDGHPLCIGGGDEHGETSIGVGWSGVCHELLLLSGKNAPLEEDFLGSPLHQAIERTWPGHSVLNDFSP